MALTEPRDESHREIVDRFGKLDDRDSSQHASHDSEVVSISTTDHQFHRGHTADRRVSVEQDSIQELNRLRESTADIDQNIGVNDQVGQRDGSIDGP
jgi:hypothetical protein